MNQITAGCSRCPKCGHKRFDPIAQACERRQCGYAAPATAELLPVVSDPPLVGNAKNITANPMTAVYGLTPDTTCRDCVHLVQGSRGRKFMKCDRRKITNGAATDHRVRWPACGLWEKRP